MAIITALEGKPFHRDDLRLAARREGLSMFLRTRNGGKTLAPSIRSHMPFVDEIVVLYNRCTDDTEAVLAGLQDEFGPERLKLYHYLPPVHPPGSEGHRSAPPQAPQSLVNYYNTALALTSFRIASKLDDDHLGIARHLHMLGADLRAGRYGRGQMACFSGLNLCADDRGGLGILKGEPFSGGGDIGFFPVSEQTVFSHDRRFESFGRAHLERVFAGFVYWHLKYLKPEYGFGNYDLETGTNERYARKREAFLRNRQTLDLDGLKALEPRLKMAFVRLGGEKGRLIATRWRALREGALTADDFARAEAALKQALQ